MAKTDMTKWEAAEKARYLKSREKRVQAILKEFYDDNDAQTCTQDLLTDILHFCKAQGFDYFETWDAANEHYMAEQAGGQHG